MRKPYRKLNWLRTKYVVEELSIYEIGDLCDVSGATISYWLRKHSISARGPVESSFSGRDIDARFTHREWLYNQYVVRKLSSLAIADKCGVSSTTILKWLEEHGIARRDISADSRIKDSKWLRKMYLERSRTAQEIASLCGCSDVTVWKWLHRHNIPTREQAPRSGPDHPNWRENGDLSIKVRSLGKYHKWKRDVLRRDCNICVWCEATHELAVDHIYPLSAILEDQDIQTVQEAQQCGLIWDVSNGRTLCVSCHSFTPSYGGGARGFASKSPEDRKILDRIAKEKALNSRS